MPRPEATKSNQEQSGLLKAKKEKLHMSLYRGLNKEQLDALYNNQAACGNFSQLMAEFDGLSKKVYADYKGELNVPYAKSTRTTFDFLDSGVANAPTYIFIHGGYWQACNKEDFACIAQGPLQSGINVVLAEYTLAPEASMTRMVREIGALLDFLHANSNKYKISKGKVVLSGHSAGGHLTDVWRNHPIVSHAMPISALVDLYPISLTYLNDKLKLTDREIEDYSPIRHVVDGVPTAVVNGSGELLELIRNSVEYAEALMTTKSKVSYHQSPNDNHFTQLHGLIRPDGLHTKILVDLLKQ